MRTVPIYLWNFAPHPFADKGFVADIAMFVPLLLLELIGAVVKPFALCMRLPLGSLVGPSFAPRSSENFLVAMAGLVTNGAIVLAIALGLNLFAGAHFVWNPFGNEMMVNGVPIHDAGAPTAGQWNSGDPLERRLGDRLVRLPELGVDGRQHDSRTAVRHGTNGSRLAGQCVGRPVARQHRRPVSGAGLCPGDRDRGRGATGQGRSRTG